MNNSKSNAKKPLSPTANISPYSAKGTPMPNNPYGAVGGMSQGKKGMPMSPVGGMMQGMPGMLQPCCGGPIPGFPNPAMPFAGTPNPGMPVAGMSGFPAGNMMPMSNMPSSMPGFMPSGVTAQSNMPGAPVGGLTAQGMPGAPVNGLTAQGSMPVGTIGSQLPIGGPGRDQESYIENILRLNLGKMVTIYMTFENNTEWNAKIFKGRLEAAGRDHIIISDPQTGKRYLLLMIYLDYITFDEPIEYAYPYHTGVTQ